MSARATAMAVLLLALPAQARDPVRPAELPPASYAGQQYVDSKGCLFMRAGTGGQVLWLPRVTREGVPICGHPPSGRRVPVVGEAGVVEKPVAKAAKVAEEPVATPAPAEGQESFVVAIGSFGVAENAERAAALLKALGYPVARGRMEGGSTTLVTIFAGPFASAHDAAKAQRELRGAGFPDAVMIER